MSTARSADNTRLATLGEAAAAEELQLQGYSLLTRNYRCRGGEADIVAREGETLVFVEVKTRSRLQHGLPREAVGWTKQQRLGQAALHYCSRHATDDPPVRFDVVEVVVLRNEVADVNLIRNAFVPEV
jgi:putative endonuclease